MGAAEKGRNASQDIDSKSAESAEVRAGVEARKTAKLTSGESVEDTKALAYLGVNPLQQMAAAVAGKLVAHFWIVRPLLTKDTGMTELYNDILAALHDVLDMIDVEELDAMLELTKKDQSKRDE